MGGVILELGVPVPLSLNCVAYCFLHLWHSVQYITLCELHERRIPLLFYLEILSFSLS